jgi:hypothetical protein
MAILRCPKCRGALTERSTPHGLACAACHLLFSVEDGIPNLLLDEAKPDSGPTASAS